MKNVNSDIAYDHIRKRILNGEYAPGFPLMTNVLAEEIGVSRTPVRDALRQLETDGLVSIQPRIGASVKAMNLREFREMCGMRLALESHAAGLAAQNRTDADLEEIGYALERMRRLTDEIVAASDEQELLNQLVREDVRFHVAIMTAAKNELMKKEILRLHLINRIVSGQPAAPIASDRKQRDERRQAVLVSHQDIFDAIQKKDVGVAKSSMEQHLQEMIDHHVRLMARASGNLPAKELSEEELAYSASI